MTTAVGKVSLAKQVATVIREHTQKAFTPLRARIEAQERRIEAQDRRIAEMEAGRVSTLTFADLHRGVWSSDNHYVRGQLVTDHGSVWLALSETGTRPGSSPTWRLIVKAGRDGRDAR